MKKLLVLLLLVAHPSLAGSQLHLIREINPTIDTTQYLSGDQLDAPKRVVSALDESGGAGPIHNVVVVDNSGKASPIRIWLFQGQPVMSSLNNQPINITAAAASTAKRLGVVSVAAADYVRPGNNHVAIATVQLDRVIKALDTTEDVWAVVEAASTITYNAANDLSIQFGIESDD